MQSEKNSLLESSVNSNTVSFRLKKPVVVRILAICFLLAPIFNLAVPLLLGGHSQWHLPGLWWELFLQLPWFERLFLALTSVAGVLLFFQKKTSWFVAVLILVMISIHNFVNMTSQHAMSGVPIVINMGILVVFYFFRFPYLDKRDHIFGGYEARISVQIPVKVNGQYDCHIRNLSSQGCFLDLSTAVIPISQGDLLEIGLVGLHTIVFKGRVAHIRGGIGVQFVSLTPEHKKFIRNTLSAN